MAWLTSEKEMSDQENRPEHTPAPLPSGEAGFTAISHPILRYWMAILSGDAFKALLFVIDRTWGWQKQEEYISLSDFKKYMGLPMNHDEAVYRALHELLFFQVIGEGKRGKRREKSYFVTLLALNTTRIPLVEKEGRWYLTTPNGALVELLTLRKELHSHHVRSGTNHTLVTTQSVFARQTRDEAARRKSSQRAKETSLKKKVKDTEERHLRAPTVARPPAKKNEGQTGAI